MNIFIDTSAFYAIMSEKDENHVKATLRWNTLLDEAGSILYTTNYIAVETNALLRNRLGMDIVRDFTHLILPVVTLLWIDDAIHHAATEASHSTGIAGPSLVDHSSFIIMQEHGITHALAFDEHFRQRGY